MPAQNVIQVRRKSNANPRDGSPEKASSPKKLDLGSPIGPHRETHVKDRIKKWQVQNDGSIFDPNEIAVESDTDAKPVRREERQRSPKRRASPTRQNVDTDVRKAVAPKKRIISDGHWVKKIPKPKPEPPSPSPPKPEAVWVRKPATPKEDEQVEFEPLGPDGVYMRTATKQAMEDPDTEPEPAPVFVRKPVKPKKDEEFAPLPHIPLPPLSPVKKRASRPKNHEKTPETPPRKPSGIEAWINEIDSTPPPKQSAGKSRASRSSDEGERAATDPPRRTSRQRRRQIGDMSWQVGDENLDSPRPLDPHRSRRSPKTAPQERKRASSPIDTRNPRERAAELVAQRRESDHRTRQRTRSVSPIPPPPPLAIERESPKPRRTSRRERPRSVTPPTALPAPEEYRPRRSSRRERTRSVSPPPDNHVPRHSTRRERPISRGKSEPVEERPSTVDEEDPDVERRRLQRSTRERKVGDFSNSLGERKLVEKPALNEDAEGDVERHRLLRSLRERDFSYTPTILPDEISKAPKSAPPAPSERLHSRKSSKTVPDERPKSSHGSTTKQEASRVHSEPLPAQAPQPAPLPLPKVFGSRVQQWLTSTQDPFVDDQRSSSAPPKSGPRSEVSSAYLASSYFTNSTFTDSVAPSDAISNAHNKAANRAERERRRARLRNHDSRPASSYIPEEHSSPRTPKTPKTPTELRETTPEVEAEPSSGASASTLKRRGAHRNASSPAKERVSSPMRDSPPPEASEFTASTASSAPPPPPPPHSASDIDDNISSATSVDPLKGADAGLRHGSFPIKRPFPTTGKRLSTIASVETFTTKAQNAPPSIAQGSEILPTVKEDRSGSEAGNSIAGSSTATLRGKQTSLKRKLTTHADLMSVLSLPRSGKSIVSARSIRTNRSRLATATMEDLMGELASDEAKYMRELRTLVDGVIPVLLGSVLSKADSVAAAGLFSRTANGKGDANATQPIVEMGVALERLKAVHKRIPAGNADALLTWADNAKKVYTEYVKAWRLGFQDVVVNLAPADKTAAGKDAGDAGWEDRLPQNEDGDIVDDRGERVDVAFLLKRPLVRVRYLAKTLKGMNILEPSNQAEDLSNAYQDIVILARNRTNEERARLEDEAAANIDAARARDLKTLAPLAGVTIDSKLFVKARDYFDLHLLHSSGQEVDCRIEILMRDAKSGQQIGDYGGDLLICEVDGAGRWLLFPPILRNRVSARKGDAPDQIILMLRGIDSSGQEWHELLSLTTNDEQAALEWTEMFGATPVPPKLTRMKSFMGKSHRPPSSYAASSTVSSSYLSAGTASTPPLKSRTPSPREIEVPIGEKASKSSKRWSKVSPENKKRSPSPVSPITPPSDEPYRERRTRRSSHSDQATPTRRHSGDKDHHRPRRRSHDRDDYESDSPFKSIKEAILNLTGNGSPTSLKRSKANRFSRHFSSSPAEQELGNPYEERRSSYQDRAPRRRELSRREPAPASAPATPAGRSEQSKGYSVWYPPSNEQSSESEEDDVADIRPAKLQKARPELHRRASSVPSMDLPSIPKLRTTSQKDLPTAPFKEEPATKSKAEADVKEASAPAPSKLQKELPARYKRASRSPERESPPAPPAPPPHRSSVNLPLKSSPTPQFTPTPPRVNHRRASSPLKHEYQPSTASESSSDTGDSASEDDWVSSESEIDDDDVPLALLKKPIVAKPPTPPETLYSPPGGTVAPSQSASQAPYRTVPQQAAQASKAIASIFAWSDKGHWEPLHPDECSMIITPGLIEAFEMSAAHSLEKQKSAKASQAPSDSSIPSIQPLIGLELTPLVPLRRGTAVDISIRSPPTQNSLLAKAGNNIMLRSRSPEECDALYNLINYARINNPTYIALQNARGPQGTWAAAMDRQNAERVDSATGGGSRWQFGGTHRSKSYRASSTRAASTSALSEGSIRSSASMFSAMKRFSSGGRLFDVAKSSVSWKRSSGGSSSFDSLSGSGGSGSSTPPLGPAAKKRASVGAGFAADLQNAPLGTIASIKARLYIRESNNRWRDLGQTKLNIMQPGPPPTPRTPISPTAEGSPGAGAASTAPSSSTNSSTAHSANSAPPVMVTTTTHSPRGLQTGPQKRILVLGKTKGEPLLDVTLGESSFERVGRTGVAVSVWERIDAPVAARGGVAPAVVKTYMLQVWVSCFLCSYNPAVG